MPETFRNRLYGPWLLCGLRAAWVSVVIGAVFCASCGVDPTLSYTPVWIRGGLAFEDKSGLLKEVGIDGVEMPLNLATKPGMAVVEYPWTPGERLSLTFDRNWLSSRVIPPPSVSRLTPPQKPTPLLLLSLDIEDTLSLLSGSASPAQPTFAVLDGAGRHLAVGSSDGAVVVYTLPSGNLLWRKQITEGHAKQASFSRDGKMLYVAEQSRDGFLYAVDLDADGSRFGEVLWTFRLADDLGSEGAAALEGDTYAWVQLPGPYRVHVLGNGDVLLLGCHSWDDADGGHQRSRLYCFSPDGKTRWRWPDEGVLPLVATWMDACSAGGTIAVVAEDRFWGTVDPPGAYRAGSLYVLNGEGQPTASETFDSPKTYFQTINFWRGVAVRPDGDAVTVTTADGRSFLFDLSAPPNTPEELSPAWQGELAAPFDVGGVPVVATMGTVGASDGWALAVTGGSYVVPGVRTGGGLAPGLHPNGLTLFGSRWSGEIVWQFRLDAATQGLAVSGNGRFAAVAVSSAAAAQSPESFHGVSVFALGEEGTGAQRLLYTYPIEGAVPYSGIDISHDGLTVVLLETRTPEGDGLSSRGANRVHVLR